MLGVWYLKESFMIFRLLFLVVNILCGIFSGGKVMVVFVVWDWNCIFFCFSRVMIL